MVRHILYSLLVVIALQLSWSVVTVYCMHETGISANHLGHHEHNSSTEELSLAAKDGQSTVKKSAVHDAHCASYANLALAAPDSLEAPPITLTCANAAIGAIVPPTSIFPSPPERPQWISLA
ncbi:hypothetical protein FBX97_5730 [Herbaspirillum sp. SJZ107]|jgi:hypothetical protein|nr:hypothetical protein FBX97_5730 [Herbaspirillum sp. SJZ107]